MYEFVHLYVFVFEWNKIGTDNRGVVVKQTPHPDPPASARSSDTNTI